MGTQRKTEKSVVQVRGQSQSTNCRGKSKDQPREATPISKKQKQDILKHAVAVALNTIKQSAQRTEKKNRTLLKSDVPAQTAERSKSVKKKKEVETIEKKERIERARRSKSSASARSSSKPKDRDNKKKISEVKRSEQLDKKQSKVNSRTAKSTVQAQEIEADSNRSNRSQKIGRKKSLNSDSVEDKQNIQINKRKSIVKVVPEEEDHRKKPRRQIRNKIAIDETGPAKIQKTSKKQLLKEDQVILLDQKSVLEQGKQLDQEIEKKKKEWIKKEEKRKLTILLTESQISEGNVKEIKEDNTNIMKEQANKKYQKKKQVEVKSFPVLSIESVENLHVDSPLPVNVIQTLKSDVMSDSTLKLNEKKKKKPRVLANQKQQENAVVNRRGNSESQKQLKYTSNSVEEKSDTQDLEEEFQLHEQGIGELVISEISEKLEENNKQRQNKQKKLKAEPILKEIITSSVRVEHKYATLTVQPERNEYDEATEMLQEYSLPDEIPCREAEKEEIRKFLTLGLENNGSSTCLYISGVPGIGKTASFLEVMRQLQTSGSESKQEFQFIHINAMNLNNPESLYFILVKEMTGISSCSKNAACLILHELFTRGKLPKKYESYQANVNMKNKIILLDELDFLVTKDQEVLYNLMEWPQHRESRLTLVGIANTMDLPEKLMQKIKSRMGNRRLVFLQYSHEQITKIISQRLSTPQLQNLFETSAIEFVSRKITVSSSDIRRTLKVLRKAVELASNASPISRVGIRHIQQAYALLYASPLVQAIKKLQPHHKLAILSIALENKHRGSQCAYSSETFGRYRIMLNNLGTHAVLSFHEFSSLLQQLSSLGMIILRQKSINIASIKEVSLDPNRKNMLNVLDIQIVSNFQVDDITNALIEDDFYLKFRHQF